MKTEIILFSGLALALGFDAASAEAQSRRKFNCENNRRDSYCIEGAAADANPARKEYQRPLPNDRLFAPPPAGNGPAPEGNGSSSGGGGGGGGGGGK